MDDCSSFNSSTISNGNNSLLELEKKSDLTTSNNCNLILKL
jgi:hypothetical protein